jgi:hypothetical protein
MRKLILFISLLGTISVMAQTQPSYLGGPNTKIIVRGALTVDSAFGNAIRDTTFTPVRVGYQVYRSADSSLYVAISTSASQKWMKVGNGGGTAAWGAITGTLSSQTDLQDALDGKQDELTLGTSSQIRMGDHSLQTLSSAVTAITDPIYSPIGHSHSGLLPIGGTTGQVIMKNSSGDYDYNWQDPPSGSGTVTNIATGLWLGGGPITSTGTIQADSAGMASYFLRRKDSSVNGGYYPFSTNPKSYLVAADISGYVPATRTLTINGTTYDLSANRSWTVASTNIYNTDGTLTGDRGVTLDGHSLNFINGTGNLILWGDGTTQLQSPSFFGGYNAFVQGNTYPGEFQVNPTSSSGISTMISLVRNHSTTGSAGVGVSIDFKPPTSGGGSNLANRFISKWATVTHASRTSEVDITGVNNATDETYMNIQTGGIVRVNNNADTLSTKAYARSLVGSGSGGSGLNIYNTDSSLASDRTINGNDKFFHLDSTLNFQLGVKKQAGRYSETYGTYNTLGGYSYFDSKELAGFEATNTSNNSNIVIEAQGAADESYSKVHVYPDSIRITTPQLIINGSIYGAPSVTTSSSTSLTLTVTGSSTKSYFFTGSSAATWTLPAIGTTGQKISIKNRGSANVVVQRAGANEIYTTEAITSITMYPGDELELQDDGTYWNYLN